MAEIRQQSLIEMSRQLEEMRAHQAQQTEAEEQRSRAQELRSQAMQENISRMMEMMQTLMPRPITYPSSSNHGNTTTPTLPHPSPRPPDPVVVTRTGNSAAAEQHVEHRASLNSPGSNRSTDGASKIAENLNQGELTLGTDPSDLAAHDVLEEMPQPTKTIEVDLIDELTKDVDDDDLFEIDSCIQEDFEPPIVVDELPHQAALQVFDKMPRSFVSGELIFLDEIRKINEELVDGLNWKYPPMRSVKELDGGKVIGDDKLRNAIPTIHALKLPTEFSEKESMMNGVVCMICFDPGGNNLSHRDHAMCMSNKNFESVAGEDNKSVDEVFYQLKESYLAVGQDTQISYVAEHELQVAAAQDGLKVFKGGMTMIYMGLMCFDPGGLVARVVCPVDNDLGGLESISLLHNYTSCFAIYHKLAFGVNCAMSRIRGIIEVVATQLNLQQHNYTEIDHPFTCIVCLGLIVKAQIAHVWSNFSCNTCTKVTDIGLYNQVLIDFLPLLHGNKSNILYGQELEVTVAYNKEPSPLKLNLGVGAYRTEEGKPLVLNVVRKVEQLLVNDPSRVKEYLPIIGLPKFNKLTAKLILGSESPVILENRVATAQGLSGTGSLRVGSEFIARNYHNRVIYIPLPTWGNHPKVFNLGGLEVKSYRYYDPATRGLDFQGLVEDLEAAPSGAIVLLHACAHNPIGVDPTHEQWEQIRQLIRSKELLPLFDSAYQGFTSGSLDVDAQPVRMFAADGGELFTSIIEELFCVVKATAVVQGHA